MRIQESGWNCDSWEIAISSVNSAHVSDVRRFWLHSNVNSRLMSRFSGGGIWVGPLIWRDSKMSGLLLGVNAFGKRTKGNAWRLVRRSRLPYFKTGGSDMCQRAIFCLHVSDSCARFPSTSCQAIPGSLVSTVCETHPTTEATTSREVSSSRRMHWKDSSFHSIFCFFFNLFLKNDLEIVVKEISTETNFNATEIKNESELMQFANKVKFPSHGLILKPSENDFSKIVKGITDEGKYHLLHSISYAKFVLQIAFITIIRNFLVGRAHPIGCAIPLHLYQLWNACRLKKTVHKHHILIGIYIYIHFWIWQIVMPTW